MPFNVGIEDVPIPLSIGTIGNLRTLPCEVQCPLQPGDEAGM